MGKLRFEDLDGYDCRPDKKTGQLLCSGVKGDKKAVVLGKMRGDGVLEIKGAKGNPAIGEALKEYMIENSEAEPKDDFG